MHTKEMKHYFKKSSNIQRKERNEAITLESNGIKGRVFKDKDVSMLKAKKTSKEVEIEV